MYYISFIVTPLSFHPDTMIYLDILISGTSITLSAVRGLFLILFTLFTFPSSANKEKAYKHDRWYSTPRLIPI
ncbi:hypothetical protein BO71DRAFT_82808 [Aspergillus ellipticus CBS 707.79]|uniref:Uncharacterized protein n=1 Tax=Aspergillus ellipticus CBS 707.79 TaxID=1448320 RepID=A0A319CYS0_9EURO|nr:hypothetical protein BO71DRAFT_82808 [Aspergillus ellipticus CBS 707.79]